MDLRSIGFTKSERISIGILLILVLVYILIPRLANKIAHARFEPLAYDSLFQSFTENHPDTSFSEFRDQETKAPKFGQTKTKRRSEPKEKPNPIYSRPDISTEIHCLSFDPNLVSRDTLKGMGVPENVIRNWIKFREAGARYNNEESLQKIYGMTNEILEALRPCIRFQKSEQVTRIPVVDDRPGKYDLNTASKEQLESLPGIGKTLSERIIAFRDLLGGFYAVDQLRETYGLQNEHYLKASPFLELHTPPACLDLNTASRKELTSHPYIDDRLANAILAYRSQHGVISSIKDLTVIKMLPEDVRIKLKHYLCVPKESLKG
jgi:DNA uptake protein ComE-like DNA-binding protein